MISISEEIKEKYFIEEVSQVTNDLTGWKVLGMTEGAARVSFEIKTTLDGWLEEFRIKYICFGSSPRSGLILVNQDCSELYILYPDDIKELINECISTINTNSIEDILSNLDEWVVDQNKNNNFYNPNPWTWTTGSTWSQNLRLDNNCTITTTSLDNAALNKTLSSNVVINSPNYNGIC